MIVSCPNCAKRVRIDKERFAGKRVKLRCAGCGATFQTEVTPVATQSALLPPAPLVLVAHSDKTLCETVGEVLTRHALRWNVCHNGEDALQLMEQTPPQVAIIDVALPGLYAFEVVDKVRGRRGLEQVKIILLSSVYNKMAYKRRPNSLYGADDYIEKHHIPTDLAAKIQRLIHQHAALTPVPSAAVVSPEAVRATLVSDELQLIQEVNNRLQQAEQSESEIAETDVAAVEKARRLARIIASDIALYNQEKVEEGIRSGQFYQLLANEINEGRKHFRERVPDHLVGRDAILQEAFDSLLERRRQELHL